MSLLGLVIWARWPLEILSFAFAISPILSAIFTWHSLPRRIPVLFGDGRGPARHGSRSQVWILPVLALVVYGFMSQASGTWAGLLHLDWDLPSGAVIPLLLKPVVGVIMAYSNEMLIRIAREQSEGVNGWLLWGLMLLLFAPPFALSMVAR